MNIRMGLKHQDNRDNVQINGDSKGDESKKERG
jgi:hypothetical protein